MLLFHRYLLGACYIPGTILGAGNSAVYKTGRSSCPHGVYIQPVFRKSSTVLLEQEEEEWVPSAWSVVELQLGWRLPLVACMVPRNSLGSVGFLLWDEEEKRPLGLDWRDSELLWAILLCLTLRLYNNPAPAVGRRNSTRWKCPCLETGSQCPVPSCDVNVPASCSCSPVV